MTPNFQNLDWIKRSHKMYDYCINFYKNLTSWIVFIEVDEFIFNYYNNIDFKNFIKNLKSKC